MRYPAKRLAVATRYYAYFGYIPTDIALELAGYGYDVQKLFP